jgi:hypothetical protein
MLRFMPTHPREINLSQSLPSVIRRSAGSLQGRIGFSSALLRARRHCMNRPWLTIWDCPVRAFDDGGLVTLAFPWRMGNRGPGSGGRQLNLGNSGRAFEHEIDEGTELELRSKCSGAA